MLHAEFLLCNIFKRLDVLLGYQWMMGTIRGAHLLSRLVSSTAIRWKSMKAHGRKWTYS